MKFSKKYKKKNFYFFLSLIFLYLWGFLYLFISTPGLKGDIAQSIKISLNQVVLYRSIKINENKYLDFIKKTKYSLEDFFFNDNKFEKIEVHVSFKDLQTIKMDRKKALEIKRLINPSRVRAKVVFKNKKYDAFVRLKGDLSDHWGNIKQMSLKINLRKGKSILGMNEFSLILHETRSFPYNYLIEEILGRNDLLNTMYKTVSVKFNGENWGLMLMEESYSDSFYARHKIKEAPIFRFGTEVNEHQQVLYKNLENINDITKWQGVFDLEMINRKKILKKSNVPYSNSNFNLLTIARNINQEIILDNNENFKDLIKYFDIEKFSKSLAIGLIFGSVHSFAEKNVRYYLNPYTLKLEPIIRDHHPRKLDDRVKYMIPMQYSILFNNEKFQKIFFETIESLENNIDFIKNEHDKICSPFSKICDEQIDYNLITHNINFIKSNYFKDFNLKPTIKRKKFNTQNKDNINKKLNIRVFSDGSVQIANLTSEKLNISKITFLETKKCSNCNEETFFISKDIYPSSYNKINQSNFKINLRNKRYHVAKIEYLDENKNNFEEKILIELYNLRPSIMLKKFQTKKPDFLVQGPNDFIIPTGNYFLTEPLIISNNKNLIIEKGVQLKFNDDAYIYIENGSIEILGTKKFPIILTSVDKNKFWRGIYVNSQEVNQKLSKLTFTKISNVKYFDNQKIQLTGAINFINSKVLIENSDFINSAAEDFLNFVNSKFELNNLKLKYAKSDGIDFDFSDGQILNSSFDNIQGDAIDTSGSNVTAKKIFFDGIGDKAISAGEESSLLIEDLEISNSYIGIASKDKSFVNGKDINVKKCIKFDFAVYQKKSYFSGASMNLKNSKGCNSSLVQNGSILTFNNENIKSQSVNVKDLYN